MVAIKWRYGGSARCSITALRWLCGGYAMALRSLRRNSAFALLSPIRPANGAVTINMGHAP
eukprot:11178060-Lingulodinium_polyedra.AAC.1